MKYKVGDRVRVIKSIDKYGKTDHSCGMGAMIGHVYTIHAITTNDLDEFYYLLQNPEFSPYGSWITWREEGLELLDMDAADPETPMGSVITPYRFSWAKTGKSDTRMFLERMTKPVTLKVVEEAATRKSLTGFAVIVKGDGSKMFSIVKKDIYAMSDDKTFSMFMSYDPEIEYVSYRHKTLMGGIDVEIEKDTKTLPYPVLEVMRGIYETNLTKIGWAV